MLPRARCEVRTWRRARGWLLVAGVLTPGPLTAAEDAPSHEWPRLWGAAGVGATNAPLRLGADAKIRELWRRKIGSGYSGISTSGGRGFTADSDGTDDHALAFDLATGRPIWRRRLGPTYRGHDGSLDGPSSTPTLDAGRAFLVGPRGTLVALDTASGDVLWQHDLAVEYGAIAPGWGFGTSPLVVGPLLVVQAGGPTHNLMAFDKTSGALKWAVNYSATSGYSSPILASLAGRRQVIVYASDRLFAVDPDRGSFLWGVPSESTYESSRPPAVLPEDRVLLQLREESRLYRIVDEGARLQARLLWRSPRLRASYSPTVSHHGYLFGFNDEFLVCADSADGRVQWRARTGWGAVILVDGKLVVLRTRSGELGVAPASPRGYEDRLKTTVFSDGVYAPTTPAFADGRILLRKLTEIVALEVR